MAYRIGIDWRNQYCRRPSGGPGREIPHYRPEMRPDSRPARRQKLCGIWDSFLARWPTKAVSLWNEIPCIGVGSPGLIQDGTILYANNLQFHMVPPCIASAGCDREAGVP